MVIVQYGGSDSGSRCLGSGSSSGHVVGGGGRKEVIGAGGVGDHSLAEAVYGIGKGDDGAELGEHPGPREDEVLERRGVAGDVEVLKGPRREVVPGTRVIVEGGRGTECCTWRSHCPRQVWSAAVTRDETRRNDK